MRFKMCKYTKATHNLLQKYISPAPFKVGLIRAVDEAYCDCKLCCGKLVTVYDNAWLRVQVMREAYEMATDATCYSKLTASPKDIICLHARRIFWTPENKNMVLQLHHLRSAEMVSKNAYGKMHEQLIIVPSRAQYQINIIRARTVLKQLFPENKNNSRYCNLQRAVVFEDGNDAMLFKLKY